jgi:hypothetical protein
MNIKIHFLHSHLDKFPANLDDYSEEQGERFHQDMKITEERYQGRWDSHMIADYCWTLQRDCPDQKHDDRIKKKHSTWHISWFGTRFPLSSCCRRYIGNNLPESLL